jgi:hypothetical protein
VGARERIGEALALTARSGYPAHEIWQRAHLGWIARLQGDHATAVRHGRRAVELAEQAGHHWWLPSARALLAGTLLECGGHDEAVTLLTDVVARARQDGMQAHRLRCLAPLAEATGDPAVLAEADALLRGIDAPPGAAWLTGFDVYIAVARAWLNGGEAGRARDVLAPLLAAAARTGWVPVLAVAGLEDGRAAAGLGQRDVARVALRRAHDLAREHGMPHCARRAADALADLG